jgi:hypothetical protein
MSIHLHLLWFVSGKFCDFFLIWKSALLFVKLIILSICSDAIANGIWFLISFLD